FPISATKEEDHRWSAAQWLVECGGAVRHMLVDQRSERRVFVFHRSSSGILRSMILGRAHDAETRGAATGRRSVAGHTRSAHLADAFVGPRSRAYHRLRH